MPINTGFTDSFKRIHENNVDEKFGTNVFQVENVPSIVKVNDLAYIQGIKPENKEYHPRYPIMTRYIANYVFYKGIYTVTHQWNEDQDDYVKDFERDLLYDPELRTYYRIYCTSCNEFDWDNRVFTQIIDGSLRPQNEWIDEGIHWRFDGSPIILESRDTTSESACIVARDLYGWTSYSMDLVDHEITYTRTSEEAYIFTYRNPVTINETVIPPYNSCQITSPEINISADDIATIIVKEKKLVK